MKEGFLHKFLSELKIPIILKRLHQTLTFVTLAPSPEPQKYRIVQNISVYMQVEFKLKKEKRK